MPPRLSRETPVLVIDDSPAIRARMESYLRRLGFAHVRSASNVEEALAAFREAPADLVFLDLVIDAERGLDFAAQALTERPFTNVVLMTALPAAHEQVTAAIAEGARDYLAKPVTLPALEAVLARLERALAAEGRDEPVEDASYV